MWLGPVDSFCPHPMTVLPQNPGGLLTCQVKASPSSSGEKWASQWRLGGEASRPHGAWNLAPPLTTQFSRTSCCGPLQGLPFPLPLASLPLPPSGPLQLPLQLRSLADQQGPVHTPPAGPPHTHLWKLFFKEARDHPLGVLCSPTKSFIYQNPSSLDHRAYL